MPRKVVKGREAVRPGERNCELKKARFLNHFRRLRGKQYLAARATGIHVNTVWNWRKADEKFEADYNQALEESTDDLEVEMERRAMDKGGKHDLLMMFALKGRRPEKYRDNVKLEHTGGITVADLVLEDETDAKKKGGPR